MKRLLLLVLAFAGIAAAQHSVTLTWTWTQSSGGAATGFLIQRGTASGGPYVQVGAVPVPNTFSYVDQSATGNVLTEGTTYYYVVLATGPGGNSLPSPQASATIPFLPPSAPPTLSAVPK